MTLASVRAELKKAIDRNIGQVQEHRNKHEKLQCELFAARLGFTLEELKDNPDFIFIEMWSGISRWNWTRYASVKHASGAEIHFEEKWDSENVYFRAVTTDVEDQPGKHRPSTLLKHLFDDP